MPRRRGRGAAPHGCGCYSSAPARRALAADLFPLERLTYAEQLDASDDPRERELACVFAAIEVPAYRDPRLPGLSPADNHALARFNDAILDALMALNEVRAAAQLSRRTS